MRLDVLLPTGLQNLLKLSLLVNTELVGILEEFDELFLSQFNISVVSIILIILLMFATGLLVHHILHDRLAILINSVHLSLIDTFFLRLHSLHLLLVDQELFMLLRR